ncbi:hypothetical protein ACJX0J_029902, partial [Zea mays]
QNSKLEKFTCTPYAAPAMNPEEKKVHAGAKKQSKITGDSSSIMTLKVKSLTTQ